MDRRRFVAQVAMVAGLMAFISPPIHAATVADMGAFAGRWQLDPAKTHMGRMGPGGDNLVRAPTFTFIFSPIESGMKLAVYAQYPQPAPTRVTSVIPDGKQRSCEDRTACQTAGGRADEQSYRYDMVDPHLLVRSFFIKGNLAELTTYSVSSNGRVFTLITWSQETPEYQNIQVFDKQP